MTELQVKNNQNTSVKGIEVSEITFNIQSNEDIINALNHMLNLFVTGQITDRQLKALAYPMQLFQSSLKARDVDAKIISLFKQVEELKGVR